MGAGGDNALASVYQSFLVLFFKKELLFLMLTAIEMLAAYRSGKTSPVEVVETSLAAISADPTNSWTFVAGAESLQAAKASEARWRRGEPLGALDGVPIGVKDLLAVTGQKMRRGSLAYPADYSPPEDVPIISRLREAGAILIGKTATPDAGCKLDTTSLAHGVTRNPFDLNLTPGGSSGGSAAALALGHVPIALGTDGGGSIRVPAAYCGVFGLKPSTGRIPAPLGPFWPHAVTGPMSRNVADTALAWNVVTRPDARDPYAFPGQQIDWLAETGRGVAGLRIAIAESFNGIGTTPELRQALRQAAAILSDAGASIHTAEPAWPCDPLEPFMVFWRCMYAASLALLPPPFPDQIDPVIKCIIAEAAPITRQQFQTAIQQRDMLALALAKFHLNYDLLLCPVMPCQPWAAGRATPPPLPEDDWSWCPFAYPFNLTRQPAASVPLGADSNGIKLAVQLIAGFAQDGLVLRAARAIEANRRSP
jgi:aspartyl-tRNA(Asn)/glutamyl-tRNA(Gln) amidotransferase subunit A